MDNENPRLSRGGFPSGPGCLSPDITGEQGICRDLSFPAGGHGEDRMAFVGDNQVLVFIYDSYSRVHFPGMLPESRGLVKDDKGVPFVQAEIKGRDIAAVDQNLSSGKV